MCTHQLLITTILVLHANRADTDPADPDPSPDLLITQIENSRSGFVIEFPQLSGEFPYAYESGPVV